jgi:hypothetical protein
VSTLGSSSGLVAQPANAAPEDWKESPLVQLTGGFLGGLCLGGVPFAGVSQQLLDATGALPHRNPEARLGLALGQIVGGIIATGAGVAGDVGGGVLSLTGFGSLVGVPVVVGSATGGGRRDREHGGGGAGAQAPPKSGETAATAMGRTAHRNWQPPPGFQKEVRLPSGRRVDALNPATREVIELKPNNPAAIREGQRQLERYVEELESMTGKKWTGRVETY